MTIVTYSVSNDQVPAFKAFGKAMKVKVDIQKPKRKKESKKEKFIQSFKRVLNDVKLIQEGKLKGTPLKEFLNEL